jgi:hypothetical protein
VKIRAKLKPDPDSGETLTFQDLRRAATDMFVQAGLDLGERDLMLGHANKVIDSTYSNSQSALDYKLGKIQDKLDKHRLKRYELDQKDEKVFDDEGEPVLIGMTLAEAVRRHNGRKVTNQEMLERGAIPIAALTKHDAAKMGLRFDEKDRSMLRKAWLVVGEPKNDNVAEADRIELSEYSGKQDSGATLASILHNGEQKEENEEVTLASILHGKSK